MLTFPIPDTLTMTKPVLLDLINSFNTGDKIIKEIWLSNKHMYDVQWYCSTEGIPVFPIVQTYDNSHILYEIDPEYEHRMELEEAERMNKGRRIDIEL